jgi:hypothetical protein
VLRLKYGSKRFVQQSKSPQAWQGVASGPCPIVNLSAGVAGGRCPIGNNCLYGKADAKSVQRPSNTSTTMTPSWARIHDWLN